MRSFIKVVGAILILLLMTGPLSAQNSEKRGNSDVSIRAVGGSYSHPSASGGQHPPDILGQIFYRELDRENPAFSSGSSCSDGRIPCGPVF